MIRNEAVREVKGLAYGSWTPSQSVEECLPRTRSQTAEVVILVWLPLPQGNECQIQREYSRQQTRRCKCRPAGSFLAGWSLIPVLSRIIEIGGKQYARSAHGF